MEFKTSSAEIHNLMRLTLKGDEKASDKLQELIDGLANDNYDMLQKLKAIRNSVDDFTLNRYKY